MNGSDYGWRRARDKPLPKPISTQFADDQLRHQPSMSQPVGNAQWIYDTHMRTDTAPS